MEDSGLHKWGRENKTNIEKQEPHRSKSERVNLTKFPAQSNSAAYIIQYDSNNKICVQGSYKQNVK
jgi:hypothetical protein